MNAYEVVKVHGEGQYPFTYRGENRVLLGRFEKIFSFSWKLPQIPLKWKASRRGKSKGQAEIFLLFVNSVQSPSLK